MAGEPSQIRRDIAETRREIDVHLQELGGRVRRGLNVSEQARRNLTYVLGATVLAGLAAGVFFGGFRRPKRRARVAAERLRREISSDIP
ncbi:MAG: hypothetical protein K6V36_02620 [Anaerolineae bacterium]|nr:hypothetical protein [Anaerolineae bacterium]